MTRISKEGITLRNWRDSDAYALPSIANCKEISDNLRDGFPYPYTVKDARNWLSATRKYRRPPTRYFAIEYNGKLAGSIGFVLKDNIYRKNAEIGYFIGREYWGRGIATIALGMIVGYVFDNFDVERVYAEPYAYNMASRKVLEKSGFICEAILKKYVIKNNVLLDSCIYSQLRPEKKR